VTVDSVPYVGPLTRWSDRVQVATGFGKWGLTNGTAAAMLLAGRITGSPPEWGSVFDSTRLAPRQSATRLVKAQSDVAFHFVRDRLRAAGPSPADLEPGGGAVVRRGAKLVALSRADDGRVRAVSARCTHLGCIVAWNAAERTWDCPCHGSRFDGDGRVLEGPAVRDLPAVPIV
jgi:Rieske Fe-S protein